jgi:hypothetical protein
LLEARKVFARMLSSGGGGAVAPLAASDPTKRLCKLIISCKKASGLELELDHSGIHVTLDVAESVLVRLDNAGMLAYRFFEWARRQKHGVARTLSVPTTRWSRPSPISVSTNSCGTSWPSCAGPSQGRACWATAQGPNFLGLREQPLFLHGYPNSNN